ncbi:antiviral reverse transcriptase Drt4 [Vampirovibrio sp.]|uniref:antiviral reverse transcriptase Drt4 n=1 Tax=Vampirovibrio sp. TaxID=2717857 RepID=UPI003592FC4F
MSLDADSLLTALLTQNYFPNQKEKKDELPPFFSTITFSREVASQLRSLNNSKPRKEGYDQVDIRFTRHNNLFRLMNIPHPKAYAHLCFCLHENWAEISKISKNKNSLIRPKKHSDGRMIIMDYEGFRVRKDREFRKSFGKQFLVHTDITNFYPSIYSHAIPWAAVGVQEAKRTKNEVDKWYNQLDRYVQKNKRGETNGIAIGPGASNIIAELLLEKIDAELSEKYSFVRFIDDYKCYCDTYEEAEHFITDLSEKLLDFKLCLNLKKTEIITLPANINDVWVSDLSTRMPQGKDIKLRDALSFIDYAVDIHKKSPNGSVLKFAINSIASRLEKKTDSIIDFKKRLLGLSFHYPILLPSLRFVSDNIFDNWTRSFRNKWLSYTEQELSSILRENAKYKRSDAMVWSLYFLQKQGLNADPKCVEAVIETKDCLAITALLNYEENNHKVLEFISGITNTEDNYFMDNYWILLYEAYFRGLISNPYINDKTFSILKRNRVCFLTNPLSNEELH